MEGADGKAAGTDGFITYQRIGLAHGSAAPTPYQTRRAARVVTEPLHRMGQVTGTQIAGSRDSFNWATMAWIYAEEGSNSV
jgi:hypothetical protein